LAKPVLAVTFGAALALLLASSWLASSGQVSGLEADIFGWINGLPESWRPVMYGVQLLGVLVVPLGLAAIAAAVGRWRLAVALALIVPIKLALEYFLLKQIVERDRPFVTVCAEDPDCADFRDVPLYGQSFPSGHAVIAFALASLLWPWLGRAGRLFAIVAAIGVCVARVYLGAHNPLDVVAGAALGVLIGLLLRLVSGKPAAAEPAA